MAVKAKTKAKSSVLCMCIKDGREYPSDRFYAHKNLEIFPKGYIPYCKDCCNDILQYYLKKTGTIEASIWYMCALLDIPFIKRVFEKVQDMHVETDKFFETYYTYLWGTKSMKKALDSWESFSDSDVSFEEISATVKDVEAIKVQKDALELKWGLQESEEDYQYLEYLYDRYTQGIIKNPYQEDLYRDLCLARLEKRKIEQNQSSFDITKTQARILTLMNKLGIDDFEVSKPKSLSEQLIFAKIAQIEQTKPADLYKEPNKYKDYSKLRKYMKDLVLRPALNTLVGNKDFNLNLDDVESYNIEDE